LINNENESIRKFAIRNLRDLTEIKNKNIINNYFSFELIKIIIKYLLSAICKKEIYEITTIIINVTYDNKKFSECILNENIEVLFKANDLLSNIDNCNTSDFYLVNNFIIIISNLLFDNFSKKLGFEKKVFETFNIIYLFNIYQKILNIPSFCRNNIISLFTNCIKLKREKSNGDNENFINLLMKNIENFLSEEKNLDIIIKLFNLPLITKMTTDILNFLLALFDIPNIKILKYLNKNLNLSNKVIDIIKCFPDTNTFIILFKLILKISTNDSVELKFFKIYDILWNTPPIFNYIEKEILKYSSSLLSYAKNGMMKQNGLEPISFNLELLYLLDIIMFFFAMFIDKKKFFIDKIFECGEMLYTINNIFMILIEINNSKRINSCLENYLFILNIILNHEDNEEFFFEIIRCNILDFLIELIKKESSQKYFNVLILKCFDMMLLIANDLVLGEKNFIKMKLEKMGIDTLIDNFRSDSDDDLARIACDLYETYFI